MFDNSYQLEEIPTALAAMRITDVTEHSGHEWYPDTGATAHVTNSLHYRQHCQSYTGSETVMIGDGSFLPITHTGSASLPSTSSMLPLKDVLVCPDIAKYLLSVSKITKSILVLLPLTVMGACQGQENTEAIHPGKKP